MNTYSLYFQSVDDLIEVCVALGNPESVETILSTNSDTDENRIRMTHELEDFDCGNLDTHELVHSALQTFIIKDHTLQTATLQNQPQQQSTFNQEAECLLLISLFDRTRIESDGYILRRLQNMSVN